MEDWKNKIRSWINILPACLMLTGVVISLNDYEKPVYEVKAAKDIVLEEKTDKETSDADINFDDIEIELPPTVASAGKASGASKELKREKDALGYKNGTYYGTGTGFAGKIKVKVVVKKGKIKDIKVIESHDGASYIASASSLLKNIIKKQSTNVDTVSGATYSSVGLIEAVRDALKDAGLSKKDKGAKKKKSDSKKKDEKSQNNRNENSNEDETTKYDDVKYIDGTYYGTGMGFAGDIKVKVVVQGGRITEISIVETKDGDEYISAASALIKTIVDGQNPSVDAVSGATYSSKGIIAAVKDALKSAIAPNDSAPSEKEKTTEKSTEEKKAEEKKPAELPKGKVPYKDGVYTGTGEGYRGDISVSVTIKDKTITSIVVTDTKDDEAFFAKAKNLLNSILSNQNTGVDTVSGATFSSNGLIDAVNDALLQAKKATENDGDKNEDAKQKDKENKTGDKVSDDGKENKDDKETNSGKEEENAAGEESKALYKDGTYTLAVLCSPDANGDFAPYTLSVTLVIKDGRIESISNIYQVDEGADDNSWYIDRAVNGTKKNPGVVSQIKEKNGVEQVDAVSGATCSSNAIISAVRGMLDTAKN